MPNKWTWELSWTKWYQLKKVQTLKENHWELWHKKYVEKWLFEYYIHYSELIKNFGLQIETAKTCAKKGRNERPKSRNFTIKPKTNR